MVVTSKLENVYGNALKISMLIANQISATVLVSVSMPVKTVGGELSVTMPVLRLVRLKNVNQMDTVSNVRQVNLVMIVVKIARHNAKINIVMF